MENSTGKLYEAVLKEKGKTPAGFDAEIRQAVLVQQLSEAYTQNGYAAKVVAENLIRLNEQKRIVAVANLDAATFINLRRTAMASSGLSSEFPSSYSRVAAIIHQSASFSPSM